MLPALFPLPLPTLAPASLPGALLTIPVAPPFAPGSRVAEIGLAQKLLRFEAQPVCGGPILGRVGIRDENRHHDVREYPGAERGEGDDHEQQPNHRDIDIEKRSETIADAG